MASKKNFDKINTGRMYDAIADATAPAAPVAQEVQEKQHRKNAPRKENYTEEERAEFVSSMQTSGRKGLALPRINMAFSPDQYDFIKTMARVSGITMTDFVNRIIGDYMTDHSDQYKKALEFRNSL